MLLSNKPSARHLPAHPPLWHKSVRGLAFLVLMCVSAFAQGANVVFFSTTEGVKTGSNIVYDAWSAFSSAAQTDGFSFQDANTDNFTADDVSVSTNTVLVTAGALSDPNTPLSSYIGADTKVIVVVSVFNAIDPARMTDLQTIMQTNPNIVVVAFLDGCCSVDTNLAPFLGIVNTIRPSDWSELTQGAKVSGYSIANLNTDSIYSETFAGNLSQMYTQAYITIDNVPANYALYTQTPAGTTVPDPADDVVGLFIPQQASNNGQGACVFLTGDSSEFDPGVMTHFNLTPPQQYDAIASDFIAAATDPNGACSKPVAGQPSLTPVFSGPSDMTIGVPATLTLTITNAGDANTSSTAGASFSVTLPTGLRLAPVPASATLLNGATGVTSTVQLDCSLSGNVLTCTGLPALAAGDDQTAGDSLAFAFQVTPTSAIGDQSISAVVYGDGGNDPTTAEGAATVPHLNSLLDISATAAPIAQPVPTLTELALALLVLLMAGSAAIQTARQRARRRAD